MQKLLFDLAKILVINIIACTVAHFIHSAWINKTVAEAAAAVADDVM
jgi:hypothetical protein